jgi:hypothetical protein
MPDERSLKGIIFFGSRKTVLLQPKRGPGITEFYKGKEFFR